MNYKSRRAKATDIPESVKHIAYARDEGKCLWCGKPGLPNAHLVSRAQGGLGVEENIITLCVECHNAMDNGSDTERARSMRKHAEEYLQSIYPGWSREKVTYSKWT